MASYWLWIRLWMLYWPLRNLDYVTSGPWPRLCAQSTSQTAVFGRVPRETAGGGVPVHSPLTSSRRRSTSSPGLWTNPRGATLRPPRCGLLLWRGGRPSPCRLFPGAGPAQRRSFEQPPPLSSGQGPALLRAPPAAFTAAPRLGAWGAAPRGERPSPGTAAPVNRTCRLTANRPRVPLL